MAVCLRYRRAVAMCSPLSARQWHLHRCFSPFVCTSREALVPCTLHYLGGYATAHPHAFVHHTTLQAGAQGPELSVTYGRIVMVTLQKEVSHYFAHDAEEPQSPASTSFSVPGATGGPKAAPIDPRSFDGLEEAVVRSLQALCQVRLKSPRKRGVQVQLTHWCS